jgi:hypothetical protein
LAAIEYVCWQVPSSRPSPSPLLVEQIEVLTRAVEVVDERFGIGIEAHEHEVAVLLDARRAHETVVLADEQRAVALLVGQRDQETLVSNVHASKTQRRNRPSTSGSRHNVAPRCGHELKNTRSSPSPSRQSRSGRPATVRARTRFGSATSLA